MPRTRSLIRDFVASSAAVGTRGMVATKHPLATLAGVRVLQAGGNAVDAAVTAAFAVGVVEPWMSGLGGGGYLLYGREGGEARVIDFSMVAPMAARADMFPLAEQGGAEPELSAWPLTRERRHAIGPLAVAVPGAAAGLALALSRFGRLTLAEALGPAITLAEEGWPLDWSAFLQIALSAKEIVRDAPARALFLDGDLARPLRNDAVQPVVRQPDLARTLRAVATEGPGVLYGGEVGRAIVRAVVEAGGILSERDLSAYSPLELEPMSCDHAGLTVLTTPANSGGPTVLEILRRLGTDATDDPRSPNAVRRFARAARSAMDAHASGAHVGGGSTTHISVVDAERNMVALTTTLHSRFGAYFTAPGTGVMLNNGMLWFDPRPGQPLSVGPGVRPPTNMAPVLIADGPRAFATVGASGGRKIPGAIAQLAQDLIVHRLTPQESIALPRVDASGPSLLADERLGIDVIGGLRDDGHDVTVVRDSPFPQHFASPLAILVDAAAAALNGAADPFANASCAGY